MSIQPGCQFASDNTAGICPEAMSAMTEANQDAAKPYGEDPWTKRATSLIREVFEVDCDVFFTFNGTAANALALSAMCQSHHGVLAHRWSHVETDECGAPEFSVTAVKSCWYLAQMGVWMLTALRKSLAVEPTCTSPRQKHSALPNPPRLGQFTTLICFRELERVFVVAS